jgi:hypothetical protein
MADLVSHVEKSPQLVQLVGTNVPKTQNAP